MSRTNGKAARRVTEIERKEERVRGKEFNRK